MGQGRRHIAFQVRPHLRKMHQAAHHVVAAAGVEFSRLQIELRGQQRQQIGGHGLVVDQAHGSTAQTVFQALFHFFNKAFRYVIVQ